MSTKTERMAKHGLHLTLNIHNHCHEVTCGCRASAVLCCVHHCKFFGPRSVAITCCCLFLSLISSDLFVLEKKVLFCNL